MNNLSRTVPFTNTSDGGSSCHVALLDGPSVTFWACPGTAVSSLTVAHEVPNSVAELALSLAPERLIVVGRSTGRSPVPYLDPAYRPTPILPESGRSVLRGHDESDNWVSRAHFTLRGAPGGGIVFTNGVPQAGGGLRAPLNGTKLLSPAKRWLGPGEEVLIELGEAVAVRLPNRCVLQFKAQ
ncbi:MAG: hypothetical protein J0I06_15395 [Planctomycetes bacterium]|nr:hypothetical protein [Planctomycetota bacterium]